MVTDYPNVSAMIPCLQGHVVTLEARVALLYRHQSVVVGDGRERDCE